MLWFVDNLGGAIDKAGDGAQLNNVGDLGGAWIWVDRVAVYLRPQLQELGPQCELYALSSQCELEQR